MNTKDLVEASLIKTAGEKGDFSLTHWLSNDGPDPQLRDTALGVLGGGAIGGLGGMVSGKGFWGPALAGGLAGGLGGYFRKPLWENVVQPAWGALTKKDEEGAPEGDNLDKSKEKAPTPDNEARTEADDLKTTTV